ncbi:unnamed protein product [Cyprideis torosa]|uniref:Uncharacterized protein n=1 Tax=Cyprideis torosa TaxID=163714 RepID=A0A7R8ZSA1_9CRUS|nr:unnamed protein product [Cyprideis torosa]CAG0905413.1 unnamed protein product [Cyprideis torosa]
MKLAPASLASRKVIALMRPTKRSFSESANATWGMKKPALTTQMMKIKIPFQVVLVSLWISGLLSLEVVKLQKFPGYACNTKAGDPTQGMETRKCLYIDIPFMNIGFATLEIGCSSGFEFRSEFGKCYFFSNTQTTWHEAEDHCASLREGAHLASIHSASEMDYLFSSELSLYGLEWWRIPFAVRLRSP